MHGKIVLVSNDSDFFEYIIPKLSFRSSDELFKYDFNSLQAILSCIDSSILIINSENNQQQTLELLNILNNSPAFVFSYNIDEEFKIQAYNNGMFGYFTLSTTDAEFEAQLKPALKIISSYEKNNLYRKMLVDNNLITKNNEVFLDFTKILDAEIDNIHKNSSLATLLAISPDDNAKFLIKPNQIETIILNTVRSNDRLMTYAANKYFLLLHNSDIDKAMKLWDKLHKALPEGVYAGFASVGQKSRQQVVNEALHKLHEAINSHVQTTNTNVLYSGNNFKFFRKEFKQKLENVIIPVFYHIQQTYNDKLFGMKIEQGLGDGYGVLYIKSSHSTGTLRITCPGFSTVNIDITFQEHIKNQDKSESKRITLEPEELEAGLLQDILEQFIIEFKDITQNYGENENDNT